jgi:ketosteroid isomerase-like protein
LNLKTKLSDQAPTNQMITEEQTASTSTSSEQAWLIIALVLVVFTVGLYWFSMRHNHQPNWSYEALVNDQTNVENPGDAATSTLIQSNPQNRRQAEDFTPTSTSIGSQNEQLVSRFYEEVINQGQFAMLDELFAEDFSYRSNRSTLTRLNLAALKQQLQAENSAYVGLQYSIEHIVVNNDSVQVDWSAGGTPRITFETHPPTGDPQVWSGHTVWQIADGKIVHMWIESTIRD